MTPSERRARLVTFVRGADQGLHGHPTMTKAEAIRLVDGVLAFEDEPLMRLSDLVRKVDEALSHIRRH